ncbi:MAG TPA: universal stress protein [Polyangiales bacterium]|nr:universal stress protein [Polyangiales bacterium]
MVIAHCSELLTLDDPAFVHAVAIAARSGAAVRSLHVTRGLAPEAAPPEAASLLQRWGRPGGRLNHAWLLSASTDDPADALLEVIARVQPELLVINTHARSGLARFFAGSVAEGIARNVAVPVLLLPSAGPGLVDAQSGALTLTRALLLAGSREDTERAARGLSVLTKLAAVEQCALELLHVEDTTPTPHAVLPAGFAVTQHRAQGPLERAVAERVVQCPTDLIVMTSHGHDQLSDVVFSSHTERVLHEVRRPLLWVPALLAFERYFLATHRRGMV